MSVSSDTELCARFQKGDLSAFTELAKMYSKLISTIGAKYAGKQLPKSELVLYAKIGLLKAAHRYDESKMVSFRLYAIWWMRQSIMKAILEQVKIEQVPEMLIHNMRDIIASFRQKGVLEPGIEYAEISDAVESEISGIEKFKVCTPGGDNTPRR